MVWCCQRRALIGKRDRLGAVEYEHPRTFYANVLLSIRDLRNCIGFPPLLVRDAWQRKEHARLLINHLSMFEWIGMFIVILAIEIIKILTRGRTCSIDVMR